LHISDLDRIENEIREGSKNLNKAEPKNMLNFLARGLVKVAKD